tara:strand:+ start:66813 stop:67832 length:1020 start_codon:yes stop_codon:yes gene_type:complete
MKKLSLLLAVFIFGSDIQAQINPSNAIAGTAADIQYLGEGYLSPFADALSYSTTNGWYNTAKVRKTLRFEISIIPSISMVPNEMKTFTIDANRLQQLELVNPNDNITPTVFGSENPGVALRYSNPAFGGLVSSQFNMPRGIGIGVMPMAGIQAGIGLPFDFELKGRFLPSSGATFIDGSNVSQWGLALKHDLLRYLPKGKLLPFSLSAFVAYSSLSYSQELEPGSGNDKEVTLDVNSLITRLLVSKKLLFLTFYAGAGYNINNADVNLLGTFEYIDPTNILNPEQQIKDPLSFSSSESSGFAGNVGIRAKFLVVGLVSADYTFGAFNALTLNLGLSWDL